MILDCCIILTVSNKVRFRNRQFQFKHQRFSNLLTVTRIFKNMLQINFLNYDSYFIWIYDDNGIFIFLVRGRKTYKIKSDTGFRITYLNHWPRREKTNINPTYGCQWECYPTSAVPTNSPMKKIEPHYITSDHRMNRSAALLLYLSIQNLFTGEPQFERVANAFHTCT
jgi:hypothetical protein